MTRSNRFAAFDIRLIIALMVGVYGLVITIMGLAVTTEEEIARSAGVNINLWAGIGMLVVGGLFVLWVVLRPLRADEEQAAAADKST